MKKIKYLMISLLLITFFSCQEDDVSLGDFIPSSNLNIEFDIVGQDSNNPYGDGSGVVNFTATADNVINYRFTFNGNSQMSPSGIISYSFSNLGVNSYEITVSAFGTGGVATTQTISVEVLATYSPPADLLDKLVGDGTRTWRIKAEKPGHFGLGPVGGTVPVEWYGAGPNEKDGVGMYDDRYVFNSDGTFIHITNNTNDDPDPDPSGTVVGRVGLIDDLGTGSGTVNGADVENFEYNDYSEDWTLIAPGGVETISLTGLGFIGYYTGGSHQYIIFDRSVENELLIKTTDGNNEFDWWFIITSDE